AAFDPALIQLRSTENSAVVDVTKKNVLLNPSAITTIALTGQPASTSVYLLNPDSKSVRGTLSLTGPGLAVQAGDKEHLEILCTAGKPDADATTPLSLDGGDFIKIQLSVLPAQSSDAKKPDPITLTWKDTAGGVARTAVWNYNWDEASSNAAVLDAAQTGLNPFIGLPVEHSVYIPETSKSTIPFRIRANHPLRIEYVDAHSGVLLAVDHNGNGDFAESGDFCAPAADTSVNSATPVVGVGSETSTAKIEVWYFPNEETKQTHDIELDIELLQNTRWEQQAVDRIKFDQ
ncbi:MAG TPA: hypothetical protein VK968_06560, partial [Roseimicrobium sp.]|nr:hypothetical protein [Roseimicrobium sp.]